MKQDYEISVDIPERGKNGDAFTIINSLSDAN